jgi:glycosyltransferase involved in cell wall biosynthesis
VLSDRSCFPEIAADAALYFNAEDSESLTAAIERVLGDATLRARLIARGLRRAEDFSWKRTARRMAEVYRQVV